MFFGASDDEDDDADDDDDNDDDDVVGVTYSQETDAAGRNFLDLMDHESAKRVDYKRL